MQQGGVENVKERSFFGTTFRTVITVCFLKFPNFCYLVAVMFSFLAVLQNSKEIVNASLQMHQKKFCFSVFKNYTLSKRFLKSWFVES